jgi:NAD dependent epimerase/dehydratase family enzyme
MIGRLQDNMAHTQHTWKLKKKPLHRQELYSNSWLDRRPRLLIVGFGDIAQRLVNYLGSKACFLCLSRQYKLHTHTLHSQTIDLDTRQLPNIPQGYQGIIYFAPPPSQGEEDSRIRHFLAKNHTKNFVYISTTGVYGDQQGRWIDETCRVHPQTARAKRRLSAEIQLRQWGKKRGRTISILRTPGIYAHNRLPIERLVMGTPVLDHSDDVYTNHIHAHDLARLSWYTLWRGKPQRIYNACDITHLKMGEYFDTIADQMSLKRPPRLSRQLLEKSVSAMQYSFMAESRQIHAQRIIQEIKFHYIYRELKEWLNEIKISAYSSSEIGR